MLLISEREGNIDWLSPIYALTKDGTCNIDKCPKWKLNPQLFGVRMTLQLNEPPGQDILILNSRSYCLHNGLTQRPDYSASPSQKYSIVSNQLKVKFKPYLVFKALCNFGLCRSLPFLPYSLYVGK